MYCHTCAERSFAGVKVNKNKKKKRMTPSSKDQNQTGSKTKLKRKGNNKKVPLCQNCVKNISVPQNNVKRGKVRVGSGKGVRKFITSNMPCKTQKMRKENRNSKTEKNIKDNARSCHQSFTNLYYDF